MIGPWSRVARSGTLGQYRLEAPGLGHELVLPRELLITLGYLLKEFVVSPKFSFKRWDILVKIDETAMVDRVKIETTKRNPQPFTAVNAHALSP